VPVVDAATLPMEPSDSPRRLRRELARAVELLPTQLVARFERYLEALPIHTGYRIDVMRTELRLGLEAIAEPFVSLAPRSFAVLCRDVERRAAEARTLGELMDAYRHAASVVAAAADCPAAAGRERALREALDYVREHYADPLSLDAVARRAGLSRTHFSRVFRQHEHTTFQSHLARLRLERARQLLATTDLALARVAELSGYRTAPYLCRVFRRTTGTTPDAYRRTAQPVA